MRATTKLYISSVTAIGSFYGGIVTLPFNFLVDVSISGVFSAVLGLTAFWLLSEENEIIDYNLLRDDNNLVFQAFIKIGNMHETAKKLPDIKNHLDAICDISEKIINHMMKTKVTSTRWFNSIDQISELISEYEKLQNISSTNIEHHEKISKINNILLSTKDNYQELLDRLIDDDIEKFDTNMIVTENLLKEGI